jgi:hypothetical protein
LGRSLFANYGDVSRRQQGEERTIDVSIGTPGGAVATLTSAGDRAGCRAKQATWGS